jgi:RHS repeat-associated protein
MTKLFVGTNTGGTDYTYSATETERYYYDALGQLTQVNYNDRNRKVVYTYDNAGNILSEKTYDISGSSPTLLTTNTYTYGDSSWGDLLTGYNNDTFTYDAIGNPLTYRDGISFTWSNGRQLQSYSKDNTTVTYTYDNSGLRLSKNVNGTLYTYLYHGGNLMQETVGTNILDYFYDASGNPLAVKYRTSANATGTYYYYARNSRGDVIGLYDSTGALYCSYSYDVWGNILSVKDANGTDITSQTDIAHLQSLRYRGYYYDSDTGFYYLQSRYYDPVTHRFISPDKTDVLSATPMTLTDKNLYAYCDNNPIMREDKDGQFWNIIAGVVIGGVLELAGQLLSGKSLSEVNWAKVGVSAVSGGLTAAVGPVAGCLISGATDVAMDALDGNINSIEDAAKSFAWGTAKAAISYGVSTAVGKVTKSLTKVEKIGKMGDNGYPGVKYSYNKGQGRAVRSIELHPRHHGHGIHLQGNKWNPINGARKGVFFRKTILR